MKNDNIKYNALDGVCWFLALFFSGFGGWKFAEVIRNVFEKYTKDKYEMTDMKFFWMQVVDSSTYDKDDINGPERILHLFSTSDVESYDTNEQGIAYDYHSCCGKETVICGSPPSERAGVIFNYPLTLAEEDEKNYCSDCMEIWNNRSKV